MRLVGTATCGQCGYTALVCNHADGPLETECPHCEAMTMTLTGTAVPLQAGSSLAAAVAIHDTIEAMASPKGRES